LFDEAWWEARDHALDGIHSPEADQALRDAGLTGQPFQFEVAVFRQALKDHTDGPKPRGWFGRLAARLGAKIPGGDAAKRLFGRALNTADNILDSFARAIPGAEGLRQIKNGVEGLVKD
jgi:hypothetical protein